MPLFAISLPNTDRPPLGIVTESLRAHRAAELWPGFWVVDLPARPEQSIAGLAYCGAVFVTPMANVDCFFGIGREAGPAAQIAFAKTVAPHLDTFRWKSGQFCSPRFFGQGQARLGPALERYERIAASGEPTPLCLAMLRQGSDKSLGWHNYTPFYTALFAGLEDKPLSLFELGIGTNNVDVPSNMGADGVPGASLRGWRTYFPHARIYAADIDRRVFIEEDRISSFFVDQTQPATFQTLWKALPNLAFDIFIDDGLHEFEASRTTIDNAFSRLGPGGIYVIEDIQRSQLEQYATYFETAGRAGMVADLRNVSNGSDNILAIFVKD